MKMISKEIKQKASDLATDKGIDFKVDEYEFCLPKLVFGSLVQISKLSDSLTEVSEKTTLTHVIKSMANDAPIKARIIATAVINSKPKPEREKLSFLNFKKKPFDPKYLDIDELTEFFINNIDSEQSKTLVDLIKVQMGINDFFQSTVSLKGINLLDQTGSKTVIDQPTPSGEE